jgi:hypothetical protein
VFGQRQRLRVERFHCSASGEAALLTPVDPPSSSETFALQGRQGVWIHSAFLFSKLHF